MSDATDRAAALTQLIELSQPTVAPTLTTTATTGEIDVILDRNRRARTWAVNTAYVVNDVILPPIRNGHRYRVTQPGTSAGTDPGFAFWPTDSGATISEGSSNPVLTWVEDGPDHANIYDVRRAAYEAWRLKAEKASRMSGHPILADLYDRCMEMAEKFARVVVA